MLHSRPAPSRPRICRSIPRPAWRRSAANDDDKIISVCGALIDNEKTARADRIKALIARGGAYDRKDMIDRAIDDYDTRAAARSGAGRCLQRARRALAQEGRPAQGAGRFRRGDQAEPGSSPAAKANYKSLAQELERLGALMAVAGKPSFNCAHRPARGGEGDLRQSGACRSRSRDQCDEYQGRSATPRNPRDGRALQREQDAFIARRNAEFGRPGYDLRKAMKERLQDIVGVDGY